MIDTADEVNFGAPCGASLEQQTDEDKEVLRLFSPSFKTASLADDSIVQYLPTEKNIDAASNNKRQTMNDTFSKDAWA